MSPVRLRVTVMLFTIVCLGGLLCWRLMARMDLSSSTRSPLGGVTGRVMTQTGIPVGHATVTWMGYDDAQPTQLASVTTDEKGWFFFPDAAMLLQRADRSILLADADGLAPALQRVRYPTQRVSIMLPPTTSLRASFVNEEGKPVSGVRVVLSSLLDDVTLSFLRIPHLADRFSAITDVHGVCQLTGLPRGGSIGVDVDDKRFTRLHNYFYLYPADVITHAGPIRLLSAGAIRGSVHYGTTGKPAIGIRVAVQGRGGMTITDKQGNYEITRLGSALYVVALDIDGDAARSWTAPAKLAVKVVKGSNTNGIDFTLIPGAVITGKMSWETGEPVMGAVVATNGPDHPQSSWMQEARTDKNGVYLLRVAPGKQRLYIGGLPVGSTVKGSNIRNITVHARETVKMNLLAVHTLVNPVQGCVLGPDGKPVAGAEVEVIPTIEGMRSWGGVLITDEQGKFNYDPVPVQLLARKGAMATMEATGLPKGGKVTLHLATATVAGATGVVVDETGQPIAGAYVDVNLQIGTNMRVYTDQNGKYLATPLWPNQRYTASLPPPYAEWLSNGSDRVDFTLKPGETKELKTLKRARKFYSQP